MLGWPQPVEVGDRRLMPIAFLSQSSNSIVSEGVDVRTSSKVVIKQVVWRSWSCLTLPELSLTLLQVIAPNGVLLASVEEQCLANLHLNLPSIPTVIGRVGCTLVLQPVGDRFRRSSEVR